MSEHYPDGTPRIPKNRCPNCGYEADAASAVSGKANPKPGDIQICLKCAAVMAFDTDLRMRGLTDAEIDNLAHDPHLAAEVVRTVMAIRHMQEIRRHRN